MRSNFIQNYEKELVESAVKSAVESAVKSAVESTKKNTQKAIAERMKKEKYSPSEILKITGVNILLK